VPKLSFVLEKYVHLDRITPLADSEKGTKKDGEVLAGDTVMVQDEEDFHATFGVTCYARYGSVEGTLVEERSKRKAKNYCGRSSNEDERLTIDVAKHWVISATPSSPKGFLERLYFDYALDPWHYRAFDLRNVYWMEKSFPFGTTKEAWSPGLFNRIYADVYERPNSKLQSSPPETARISGRPPLGAKRIMRCGKVVAQALHSPVECPSFCSLSCDEGLHSVTTNIVGRKSLVVPRREMRFLKALKPGCLVEYSVASVHGDPMDKEMNPATEVRPGVYSVHESSTSAVFDLRRTNAAGVDGTGETLRVHLQDVAVPSKGELVSGSCHSLRVIRRADTLLQDNSWAHFILPQAYDDTFIYPRSVLVSAAEAYAEIAGEYVCVGAKKGCSPVYQKQPNFFLFVSKGCWHLGVHDPAGEEEIDIPGSDRITVRTSIRSGPRAHWHQLFPRLALPVGVKHRWVDEGGEQCIRVHFRCVELWMQFHNADVPAYCSWILNLPLKYWMSTKLRQKRALLSYQMDHFSTSKTDILSEEIGHHIVGHNKRRTGLLYFELVRAGLASQRPLHSIPKGTLHKITIPMYCESSGDNLFSFPNMTKREVKRNRKKATITRVR
jgi:hypothetical protein